MGHEIWWTPEPVCDGERNCGSKKTRTAAVQFAASLGWLNCSGKIR
jgi:hypothetical protein